MIEHDVFLLNSIFFILFDQSYCSWNTLLILLWRVDVEVLFDGALVMLELGVELGVVNDAWVCESITGYNNFKE